MTHIVYRGRHIYVKPHPGIVEAEVGGNVETSAGDLGIASVLQTGTASCINIFKLLWSLTSIVLELTQIISYN